MLNKMLTENCINLHLTGRTKSEIIDEMVEILYSAGKLNDKEEYKKEILKREAQSSTGLEEGIAIPHAKTSAVVEGPERKFTSSSAKTANSPFL